MTYSEPDWSRPMATPREPKRPAHPLLLLGIPALLWLLLASTCIPFLRAAAAGPLSDHEQAAFLAANHRLILEDVGAPPGTALIVRYEGPRGDDDERVVGMSTTFGLSMPEQTAARDAWQAFQPKGMAPSTALADAFEADVYRPAWRNLDEVTRRLVRLGFRHVGDFRTNTSLQSRTVTLRRDGVTVWLGIDTTNAVITVYREW